MQTTGRSESVIVGGFACGAPATGESSGLASEDARRSIAGIPLPELASVLLETAELLDEPDPARDLARLPGVERLAALYSARLDDGIAMARQHMAKNQLFQ
jgi:hypothetical protein